MGTGIVFVYLLIAALVAPLVWVVWWGTASIGGQTVKAAPARPRAEAPARRSSFAPFPVDLALPGRRNAVTVYSTSGREVTACEGPDAGGRCSRPLADGTVPCAGCLLVLPRPIRGSFEWQIPADYRTCLLGSYDVFRAPELAVAQPV